jgi:alpha-glutamyl/putrescinyl thymine pyrophosphorylase clade 1
MSRRAPVPRPGVYELYWYYASERQAMFERRTSGLEPPWTADPILQTYKFCSVFRAADRVSQYMIRTVCYPDDDCTPADLLYRIVAFRTFSKIETWETVQRCLGRQPVLNDLADGRFSAALEATRAENLTIYTAAFILCASDAYGQRLKHLNHVELFRHMFLQHDLAEDLRTARSLADVYHLLHAYPLMGDFMSYQTAIDLNYSPIINFSENDFTQPGPGALRGIRKCFTDLGDYKPSEVIQWMVDHQEDEFRRLDLPFQGLFGRPLHAIDAQGLFCETDKYCREAAPHLTSARKRIKARFARSPASLPLFFPPKWGVNDKVPQH